MLGQVETGKCLEGQQIWWDSSPPPPPQKDAVLPFSFLNNNMTEFILVYCSFCLIITDISVH